MLDSVSSGAANGVRGLNSHVTVDVGKVVQGIVRQILHELLGEDSSPHGSSDSITDGATNGGNHGLDGKNSGDISLGRHGHDGHLLADNEDTTTKGDEDLAHDNVADSNTGLTEVNHETNTENGKRDTEVERLPLETTVESDDDTHDDGNEARAHGVNVGDVGSVSDGLVEDDDEHGVEVVVPDVPGSVDTSNHGVGEEDGAVGDQVPGNKGNGRKVLLPDDKGNDEQATEDEEADSQRRLPGVGLVGVQGKGQEEQDETSADEEDTKDVELDGPVLDRLAEGSAALLARDHAGLLSLSLVVVEESSQRNGDDGVDDGPDAQTPAESETVEGALSSGTVGPDGGEVGRGGEGDHESSALQLRGVGDEDGGGEVGAAVADVVEDEGGRVGGDVGAGG